MMKLSMVLLLISQRVSSLVEPHKARMSDDGIASYNDLIAAIQRAMLKWGDVDLKTAPMEFYDSDGDAIAEALQRLVQNI